VFHELCQVSRGDQQEHAQREGTDGLADDSGCAEALVRQSPRHGQAGQAHDGSEQVDRQVADRSFAL
jgi:hypothetical protein